MREWAVSIVEQACERGTCDFVQDVAYQLPMHTIADIVGIPLADRAWLFGLTKIRSQGGDADAARHPTTSWRSRRRCSSTHRSSGAASAPTPGRRLDDPLDRRGRDRRRRTHRARRDRARHVLLPARRSRAARPRATRSRGGLMALVDHPDQLATLRNEPTRCATRGRGDPALDLARRLLRAPRDPRHGDPRRPDRRRRPHHDVVPVGEPRRRRLRGSLPVRHHANAERPRRLRRRRRALLPRREPRPPRDRDPLRGAARTHPDIEILAPPTYSGLSINNPVLGAVRELPVRLS